MFIIQLNLGDGLPATLGHLFGLVRSGLFQDQNKFFATKTAQHILLADMAGQHMSDLDQGFIAFVMAMLIINLFKMIQIDQNHCITGCLFVVQLFQTLVDTAPVKGIGERIDLT